MSVSCIQVVFCFREVWRGKQRASPKYFFPFSPLEWKKDSGQEIDETSLSYQSPWLGVDFVCELIGPAVNEGVLSEFVVGAGTAQFAHSPGDTETLNHRLHWFPQDVPFLGDSGCFLQGSTKGAAKIWKLFGGAR